MQTYIVQYRINGGSLHTFDTVKAKSPAGAIGMAARHLTDVEGTLDIIATPQ
ncbi:MULTISPECIES: hypothetical protein [Achromobacter]|uniref:Uncharacterized protein n=1 Tax=Achromobacter xylosoxidans (strain A8) TaxID=762376 RepID=E3HYB2_ACHXA|nr:hypothetical protein [Achromobacter xylosoxidans]ADP20066.1 hypothetical protein AXYL_06784 [Achromobacter xylosoxidans A8]